LACEYCQNKKSWLPSQLIINLKTAKQIDLTILPSVLVLADKLIK
jgi:hypothetical protein